ncbi:MAG: rRNA maturation RNase YbeY [Candidatus Hydrogenedentota bacterium]
MKNRMIRALKTVVKKLFKKDKIALTIQAVSNNEIKKINRKYLRKNRVTDVIAFPYNEEDHSGNYYLGDIVVSYDQAMLYSDRSDKSIMKEFLFLSIHGILHFAGYDDKNERQRQKMIKLQNHLLSLSSCFFSVILLLASCF